MQTTTTTTTLTKVANGAIPLHVTVAIVAAHAAAEAERRELRMLARCGELLDIEAAVLGADAAALAERRATRLQAIKHVGCASTIDLAIWDGDADGLAASVRSELADASLR